jgi:type VI secretion system secreted protein VgrG
MSRYTQANRPLRIDTALGQDVLLLGGFNGSEAISQPYSFQVDLMSVDRDIEPADILRTSALVRVRLADGGQRRIHGIVSRFAQLGMRDDLVFYRAEIVPWLWFLSLSRESRIYQELTVTDILEQVFERTGYSDFEFRLTRSYPERLFCVQYRETHLAFVSRLMEEEGIYFFFEHSDDRHLLVIADDNGSSNAVPGADKYRFAPESRTDESVISELEREHVVHSGRVALRDYDYLKPTVRLAASLGEESEEIYDYPGMYRELDDGDRLARLLLEAEEVDRQLLRGVSDAAALTTGHHFDLTGHYRRDANGRYLITQVHHRAQAGDYRGWDQSAPLTYSNEFLAIPHDTPYRPARQTPRPVVRGAQTAVVVGPPGEELYVDSHGRIKVQFHWDRDGQLDEKSSCWIRVATPWGGKGWGAVSLPRIGNEVIVGFEEGDPDRPLVLGSVYNADQTPPFELPGAGIQMGMKSRSSPGGGGNNEFTMTDTKGKELLNIHAQYDMTAVIEHDDTQTVNNDRTITVAGKHTEAIQKECEVTVKKDCKLEVEEGDYTFTVVAGSGTFKVEKKVTETYNAEQETTVKKDITIKSTEAAIVLQAASQITVRTGDSTITLKKDGTISVKGKTIEIIGDDEVNISAPKVGITGDDELKVGVGSQQITCDKQKVNTSGAAINTSAVGMHEITGALVKIN